MELACQCRDKKITLINLEEEPMMEAWRILKKDKEDFLSTFYFSFDYSIFYPQSLKKTNTSQTRNYLCMASTWVFLVKWHCLKRKFGKGPHNKRINTYYFFLETKIKDSANNFWRSFFCEIPSPQHSSVFDPAVFRPYPKLLQRSPNWPYLLSGSCGPSIVS